MQNDIRVSTHNFRYAAWYRRFGAVLVDMLIVNVLVFVFFPGAFEIFAILGRGNWSEIVVFGRSFEGLSLIFAPFDYMFLMGWFFSRTAGMMLMKIRFSNVDGGRIGWKKSLLRALGYYLSTLLAGLGFLPILFHRKKQALHDRLAGTYVVMKR